MTGRSTSAIRIDGDRPLGLAGKLAYLGLNAARNAFGSLGAAPGLGRFAPRAIGPIDGTPSPSRWLCERHLASIDWAGFARAAGDIRLHEMGCGSGRAGQAVARALGAPLRYRGFDVKANDAWRAPMSGATLSLFDGTDFAGTIAVDDNVFLSQSAAEHIPGDLDYFAAVAAACAVASGPTLQIHYLPSAACLALYLFHGYRQYPAAALARVAALQAPGARIQAVALGGRASIGVHWRWITAPALRKRADARTADPEAYRRALEAALAADSARPAGPAVFWALTIRTGFDADAASG